MTKFSTSYLTVSYYWTNVENVLHFVNFLTEEQHDILGQRHIHGDSKYLYK